MEQKYHSVDLNALQARIDGFFERVTDDSIRKFLRERDARAAAKWINAPREVILKGLEHEWPWRIDGAVPVAVTSYADRSMQQALAA